LLLPVCAMEEGQRDMPQLAPDAQRMIAALAARYQLSPEAVLTLLGALQAGGGRQAQFSHPELGGMGQWSRGGMIMIGDMFNAALKARVDGLCSELATWLNGTQGPSVPTSASQRQSQGTLNMSIAAAAEGSNWWPSELSTPTAVGAQNNLRYAYFAATRRLAIKHGGRISIYDTGDHLISGVSQQQGPGQSITFTSQHGSVRLADLPLVASDSEEPSPELSNPEPRDTPPEAVPATGRAVPLPDRQGEAKTNEDDILTTIERLAELCRSNILTEEEFTAKKAELLSRL
jgi:hypothetical protein